jgi:hypothetical protein
MKGMLEPDRIIRGRTAWFAIFLLFLFRLSYGLCSEFWFPDELQVYLIGLKYYCSGHLPLFGPDVVYTNTQIPGSLQGLLVGLPFYLWPAPEAPYVLLNILSTAALCLLAHYICRRLPQLPVAITWFWVLTCPWVLNYSTHILNPSYVLPAAILFFIGFFEALPELSTGFIKRRPAFFLMGFSLMWIFQLHLSWVLLLPFIVYAFFRILFAAKVSHDTPQGRPVSPIKDILLYGLFFCAGAVITALGLLPAILQYGISGTFAGSASNIVFNLKNLAQVPTILMRMLSLVSFESTRFMGSNTQERIAFLREYVWISPFIIFAAIVGVIQPLWMLICPFLKRPHPQLRRIAAITGIIFLITCISFIFSVKGPSSHTFYLLFPLLMIFSFYCWERVLKKRWARRMTIIFLISGLLFNIAVMRNNYYHKSMYRDRTKVVNALTMKQDTLLGQRRSYDRNP